MSNMLLTSAGLTIMAGILLSGSTTVLAGGGPTAYVNEEGGCRMYDRSYVLNVDGDKQHVTVATSGNISVKCQVSGLGAGTKAVRFTGFPCIANGMYTEKTVEVIDTAGNATMTCQYKK